MANLKTGLIAAGVAFFGLGTSSAWAHAKLASAVPPANGVVEVAPSEIALTFNEDVQLVVCKVVDKSGVVVSGSAPARSEGATLHIPVTALAAGQYTVSYRITGDDGHTVNGSMAFSVQGSKP